MKVTELAVSNSVVTPGTSPFVRFLKDLTLLGVSALLFALSFPSFLSRWGWFPLAFFALLPLPIVIRRNGWVANILYGFLYGYGAYGLFNYWLSRFHPLAHTIVTIIYAVYFMLLFPALKLSDRLFPRYGYLVQLLVWMAYEYLRTLGFLGYSYGIIGYSQYLFLPLARVSAVTGVWGVSALVAFPSFFAGHALREGATQARAFVRRHRHVLALYGVVLAAVLVYGIVQKSDFSESPQWRVALLQGNVDPWKGGVSAYRRSLAIHTRLSAEAELEDPDVVIWSETAFVPAVDWHSRYRTHQESYELVRELRAFLAERDTPYVIGNGDGQLANPGLPPRNPDGTLNRVDYNAVLLYEDGEIVDTYRKMHLVPFTESFPFKDQLPGVYRWLREADTHFWEQGDEFTVFETGGVRFSTPVCFEDTFGYISREFVRRGAQVIVNLTNDSWAESVAAEMQHMAIAVFRSLENRRTMVRATNGGITCTILPNGRIDTMLEPFVEGYLVSDVPVYDGHTTLYTRWGDWLGIAATLAAVVALVFGTAVLWGKRLQGSTPGSRLIKRERDD